MEEEAQLDAQLSTFEEERAITLYSPLASPFDEERALSPSPSLKIQNEHFSPLAPEHQSPSSPRIDIGDLNINLREDLLLTPEVENLKDPTLLPPLSTV